MAETKITKHAFGAKENIETAKASGAVDAYDVLHLTNGEIAWIDKDNNTIFNTPRTQSDIVVNGVTGLGISNGSTIAAGATIDDIVKMLVQKPIDATYTKPKVTLANNGGQASGSIEAGTTVTPKLKATFTKNDAGDLVSINITKNGEVVKDGTTSPLPYDGEDIIVGDETINFVASATYGDAPIKNNNLGQESTKNWFAGSTTTSSSYSIEGKRNLFYGAGVGDTPEITSDFVRGLANTKLAPAKDTTFTINVEVGQQYIAFAYPATIRDVSKVTYVEANDGSMASSFTKETIDVADARGGENGKKSYKVYTYKMAVPSTAGMTFDVII